MSKANKKQSELKYHNDVEEFIPYAAHYDENTIITKNGELMQVIKVTGFAFETLEADQNVSPLRQIIRESIQKNFKTNNFAFWFHTLRSKKDISCTAKYDQEFCSELNDKWTEKNNWNEQFVNELYISIIIEGESLSIKNVKLFFETIIPEMEINKRREALEQSSKELNEVTNNVLEDLSSYGARKLGIHKRGISYYSEIMEFASKIMNLKQKKIPVAPIDLSELLPSNRVNFQYNTVQVEGERERHYGSIFSVKEYREILTEEIDNFLQLPVQFIVSESFDYVNGKKAVDVYKGQKRIYDLSKSDRMLEISGITEVLESDKGQPTDFGEHQIIITVLEDTVKEMQKATSIVVDTLRDMGVVFIREDLFMENCYWSQMPANFDFIRRQTYLPSSKVAGFASLYNFPAGKMTGNYWGDAVTVFRTASDTPYFFNFHYDKNGHTAIIGPLGAGKTVLMNFLVSEAQKYGGKTFYFEQGKGSEIFIKAMGGKYRHIEQEIDAGTLYFNPLQLKDTPNNRKFLRQWFEYLIDYVEESDSSLEGEQTPDSLVNDEERARIKKAVELSYSLPEESRILSMVIPKIWDKDVATIAKQKIHQWCGTGKYAKYFDAGIDTSGIGQENIIGLDLSLIMQNKAVIIPAISYLLHKVENSLDGESPAIIVLDEAWKLIDNKAFVPRLEKWLERIRRKNGILIFATESVEEAENSAISQKLFDLLPTQIFLPNKNADEGYKEIFGLSDDEYQKILNLDSESRQFLLKHGYDSVLAKLSLEGLNKEISVLSSTEERISIMEQAIEEAGIMPSNWLPVYFEKLGL